MKTYEARDNATQYNAETQVFGATPEEVGAQIAAVVGPLAALTASQQTEIVRLSNLAHQAGFNNDRILALASRIVADVTDVNVAFAELDRAVTVAIEVQTRGASGSNTDDFVNDILARMAALSAENRDDEADAEADRAMAEWEERQRLETQNGIALLDAGIRTAILRRDPATAARRIARRVELETPDPSRRFAALRAERGVYYARGRDQGLNFDLEVSIDLAHITVASALDADERGEALNNLAASLGTLGERERGTARLEQAVDACQAALKERPRQRVPLDWAMTQMNLGNAFQALAMRVSSLDLVEAAASAYQACLEELTRERSSGEWATAQLNYANVLLTLGEREQGTAKLEAANTAICAALEELSRERNPIQWARGKISLGTALRVLGVRSSDITRLESSIAAFKAALKVLTRERMPIEWARAQVNLGNALGTLAERKRDTSLLNAAISAFKAALAEFTREHMPLEWARVQSNLGNALTVLSQLEGTTGPLEASISTYHFALEEITRERLPLEWGRLQFNLGNALRVVGNRESGTESLRLAAARLNAATSELTCERAPLEWAMVQACLAITLTEIADRSGLTRSPALEAIDRAIDVFRTIEATHHLIAAEDIRRSILGG